MGGRSAYHTSAPAKVTEVEDVVGLGGGGQQLCGDGVVDLGCGLHHHVPVIGTHSWEETGSVVTTVRG